MAFESQGSNGVPLVRDLYQLDVVLKAGTTFLSRLNCSRTLGVLLSSLPSFSILQNTRKYNRVITSKNVIQYYQRIILAVKITVRKYSSRTVCELSATSFCAAVIFVRSIFLNISKDNFIKSCFAKELFLYTQV